MYGLGVQVWFRVIGYGFGLWVWLRAMCQGYGLGGMAYGLWLRGYSYGHGYSLRVWLRCMGIALA